MQAKKVREVRALLSGQELGPWHARFRTLNDELASARAKTEDPLVDTVLRAGRFQDMSEQAAAEFAQIENDSFELLSNFETQRNATSEAWTELDRADKILEDFRSEASEVRARLEAVKRQGGGGAEAERLEAEVRALDERIANQARQVESVQKKSAAMRQRKDELWQQVEATWSAAFRSNMARVEYEYLARRTRAEAEAASKHATTADAAEQRRVTERIAELERELEAHRGEGARLLDAALITDFLYWPREDDVHTAYCVPLVDYLHHLNIQVKALLVYQVERAKGLGFLEPVPFEAAGGDDPRLDAFFLPKGRTAA